MTTDPYMDAKPPPPMTVFFGEVTVVDRWECVWPKGGQKILFDPNQHKSEDLRHAIKIVVASLPPRHSTVEREMVAESKEWTNTLLPSLKAHDLHVNNLQGRFVKLGFAPGRSYKNAAGEQKTTTDIKIDAIYPDFDSCQRAADEHYNREENAEASDANTATQTGATAEQTAQASPSTTSHAAPATPDPKRATILKFLPGMWVASKGDLNEFASIIDKNPLAAQYFRFDPTMPHLAPPEVQTIIAG